MTEHDSENAVGIVFPILPQHLGRFFGDGKSVFVKFFGKGRIPLKLHPGSRLFFYLSKGKREIVGDARIKEITTATQEEAWTKFADRLFLTRVELEEYVGNREGEKMLILTLNNPIMYRRPLRLPKPITMTGQYMTKTTLEELVKQNKALPSDGNL